MKMMDAKPNPYQIVIGQRVTEEKVLTARAMRRKLTPAERILWQRLRRNRLGGFHFRRQQVIAGFIADFYCHRAALVVEVDGPTHEQDYDRERDQIFADKGITVLRFTNDEVMQHVDRVLGRIVEYLRGRVNLTP